MLTALRQTITIPADGNIEIHLATLSPGAKVEVIILVEEPLQTKASRLPKKMTANDLLNSGLVGLWADRQDLADSSEFARQLRKSAENRERDA